ncbi:MAG: hypothetical protein ABSC06_27160 [Rhodopila sp.]
MAPAVHHDDLVLPGDGGDLEAPVVRVGQSAVQEDHGFAPGFAPAEHRVPHLDPVDRRVAAALGMRQMGRGRQVEPKRLPCPGARRQQQGHRGDRGTARYHGAGQPAG